MCGNDVVSVRRRPAVISGNDTAFVRHDAAVESSLNIGLTGCKIHRLLPEFQASVVKLAQLLELAHHVTALVRH